MRQVIRLPEPNVRPEVESRRKVGADLLRPYRGQYVARKDERVLFDAGTPQEVLLWLGEKGIEGAAVFRVPVDPTIDMGSHGG